MQVGMTLLNEIRRELCIGASPIVMKRKRLDEKDGW
jgi:hypothetical protein